ncbi:MAG: HugZ family protein [Gammaproteobacteria bacterium]|nr:HugZ family protein [Gammaproteobacteria bacterium]NIQ11910.1 HugZ family protein [Gammaproteobacteria bacterium]NIQ74482.1 HugZ family protein [Gammaproteobacteria bacterium]NIR26481.1 HugZ family protein [Gammaproteobacteria bacterium]NIR95650.1 HugZ family protein [Gammaproteobacteria bacterium]
MTEQASAKEARDLLLQQYQGILCTNSVEMPGYPFGSVVPYVIDYTGQPVILISTIAQHTKNINADNKVSLIVTETGADDIQTVGRVTYIGDATRLPDGDEYPMQRYYEYFPHTRDYHKTHDFHFYTLSLNRVRYIGGFGDIHWLDRKAFLRPNPFSFDEEQAMIRHMNNDHVDAIRHYCELYDITLKETDTPVMAGIDSEGFHLRIGRRIHRISFSKPVTTNTEVRQALVELAKRERAA